MESADTARLAQLQAGAAEFAPVLVVPLQVPVAPGELLALAAELPAPQAVDAAAGMADSD
jgi:hypothetical protein